MTQYIEFVLLGILLVLVYQKPNFLENIVSNKLSIILLLLLNGYIAKTYGITSGIIMAVIIIVIAAGESVIFSFLPRLAVTTYSSIISDDWVMAISNLYSWGVS